MLQSKIDEWERRAVAVAERHWKWIIILVWLGICAWFIYQRWSSTAKAGSTFAITG
jgi:hypothetical protein